MLPDDVVRFIRAHLGSVWALEAMLRMFQQPDQEWTAEALVRELRASPMVGADLLDQFERTGLISKSPQGWRWQPRTPELAHLAAAVVSAYAVTPFAVIQTIVDAPKHQISQFADAFKFRKDKD